jgi:four helix bundle protein
MSFKTLIAYQKSFNLAMEVFTISKKFPSDEKFALTSQIVRSSRGVCSAIAEAYRKRDYVKHFKSKLTDADS